MFFYTTLVKIIINEYDMNPLDMCLIRTIVATIFSGTLAKLIGASFYVQPDMRKPLFIRAAIGTIGFTCITFGVAMLPLLVQNTILNTAPFWASLIGFFALGERLLCFEIVAMFCSFSIIINTIFVVVTH